MYGHEKSQISRPGKVMDFRKNCLGHGKFMAFHFLLQTFRVV